jgi:hypothetical protein
LSAKALAAVEALAKAQTSPPRSPRLSPFGPFGPFGPFLQTPKNPQKSRQLLPFFSTLSPNHCHPPMAPNLLRQNHLQQNRTAPPLAKLFNY